MTKTIIKRTAHQVQTSSNLSMVKQRFLLPLLAIAGLATTALPAYAHTEIDFTHNDWQVACDNTLTCRLAGYQSESNTDMPVSVLLTRRAGSNANVTGKVKLGGTKESSAKALMQLGNRHRLSLFINGKDLGETKPYASASGDSELTPAQVDALVDALSTSSKIELVFRNTRFQLSDKGSTAVMLKADEAQGRVGTPSAFVKTGNSRPNSSVLPPKPAPQLRLVRPDGKNNNKKFAMKASQLVELAKSTMDDSEYCPNIANDSDWRVYRLNQTQLLAQHSCWLGAYNAGSGMWVMNDSKPYNPVLVTTDATDYAKGRILSSQKGRGIGDCMSQTNWIWTGKRFVKSHESTTGLCRLIEAGGAWQLPTYVSDVKVVQ